MSNAALVFFAIILVMVSYLFFSFFNVKFERYQFIVINLIFIILVTTLGYLYVPYPNYDLTRYFIEMDYLSRFTYLDSLTVGKYTNEPLAHILFFIIGRIRNFSLLSATTMGTIFLLITVANYKIIYNKKYNFKSYSFYVYILVVIGMTGFVNSMSGIRQMLAWSFALLAVYYDYFTDDKNNIVRIILYLIPLGFHSSAVILLLTKIFMFAIKRKPRLVWLVLLWPLLLSLLPILYPYLPIYLQYLSDKMQDYTSGYFELSLLKTLVRSIVLLLLLWWTLRNNKDSKLKDFNKYYLVILMFTFSSIVASVMFGRMTTLAIITSYPTIDGMVKDKTLIGWASLLIIILISIVNFVDSDLISHGQWYLL